ncbi:hypothetical protein HPB51_020078 [Rhipicephalus microplus]|uniref:Cullin N-terminal domain-containing protein n=1 Tax=Rhipicephalus microplus TaxID=6941 RepID=A0A9J6EAY5_RHIMP|nr:hypothetical protein HPB51_020078 [Rhipicephalus microplus]
MIGDIVKYLDIAYVPRSGFDSVGKAGVLLFRDEVARYADVRDRLRDTMLGMVQAEREGQLVDRASLKKACEMLVALGLGSTSVYEEDFQVFFLAETAQFYAARALVYIDTKDASEYVAQVRATRSRRVGEGETLPARLHRDSCRAGGAERARRKAR